MKLVAGASTQSRARRPLPTGMVSGVTVWTQGARERVKYTNVAGKPEWRTMLTWVLGQNGCLWGGGPPPFVARAPESFPHMPGSYGHLAEYNLTRVLGVVYDPLLAFPLSARYFQNGGDACAAAARVARAVTGRRVVASYGYHGAAEEWAHAPATLGVLPEAVTNHIRLEFGHELELQSVAREAACIMLEVPAWNDDAAVCTYLRAARRACTQHGIPLIIDDVVLGFRLALGGSVEYYGVQPDMVILGKAMSAAGQVAAIIGRSDMVDLLDGRVFHSTTFGGHPAACEIAAATVDWLTTHRDEVYGGRAHPFADVGHLYRIGQALKTGLMELGVECEGQPERFIATFDTEDKRRAWCTAMMDRGIIVDRPFFAGLCHDMQDVVQTLRAAKEVAAAL